MSGKTYCIEGLDPLFINLGPTSDKENWFLQVLLFKDFYDLLFLKSSSLFKPILL